MNRPSPLSPDGAVKPAPNSPAGGHFACLPAGRDFFGGIIGTLTERVAHLLLGSASTSAGGGPRPKTSLGTLPAQASSPQCHASLAKSDACPTYKALTECAVEAALSSASSGAGGVFTSKKPFLTPPAIRATNPSAFVSRSSDYFGKFRTFCRLQSLMGRAQSRVHIQSLLECWQCGAPNLSIASGFSLFAPASNPPRTAHYVSDHLWACTTGAGGT
jgi:hypothetical protein